MTIEHKLTIAALIIAFTSPFVKALAERWITKPVAIPEANKPSGQAQPKSRFKRFLTSSGLAYFFIFVTLLGLGFTASLTLSRTSVFFTALGFSSLTLQVAIRLIERLLRTIERVADVVVAQRFMLEGVTRSVMILSHPDDPNVHP